MVNFSYSFYDPELDKWIAFDPDLPGCVFEGDDHQKTVESMKIQRDVMQNEINAWKIAKAKYEAMPAA